MKVEWAEEALQDIEAHVAYLSQVNPFAAVELAAALFSAGESLSFMPYRGRQGRVPGTRELVVVYPYVIAYEAARNTVTVLRVWHGKLLT
ncbi:MAG: type II toxin-antitoxin system RelE/ParE family toxin [Rhodospirillales bacterium]|jgi:plasmid stabilization system protein ParE